MTQVGEKIMKPITLFLLLAIAGVSACSTTSNNANMRGANTNTGYTTSSETNAKPAMPANATNISPPSVTNANNSNSANRNANANTNANVKRP